VTLCISVAETNKNLN